ncbi:gamma-glutamyl-hercynylcysteine sulfoxide hydrolase [Actinomycetospora sp. NBRC 106375]|uniref:ergothioneine biosynthesis protein EgtC n=1 Tax=Actinomycetospora sp. NBRC 106375 TaxID=3032207 RepID=UPI0024A4AD98|nr:ergothioneine biosynthesis protein EgtC [Actinomycetospora sp. NBRC 106375]GLZ44034.1 gamma-glutamyl-hercynylcysteine sulfoxide hydrolase [Actinomycetospora sp. NBRC 106375]
MCRHLARLGPAPVTLASVVTEPPHSLLVQSYAPADMRGGGTVNADGFGVGWYVSEPPGYSTEVRSRTALYRRDDPMWTDASFLDLARAVETTALVAAVRSATVGMPVSTAACAPFRGEAGGRTWLFSHNGVVRGWPHSMAGLAATLPPVDLLTLEAATDSALLWALVRARIAAGKDPADAVAGVASDALAAAPGSRLNLLLSDGDQVIATAVDHALSHRVDPDGAVTVASEPLDDDPAWAPVPEGSLLAARPGGVHDPPVVTVAAL